MDIFLTQIKLEIIVHKVWKYGYFSYTNALLYLSKAFITPSEPRGMLFMMDGCTKSWPASIAIIKLGHV